MEQQDNANSSEVKTEVKTYSAEQFNGLLADKQTEVRKRQEAEKRASELDAQLAAMKSNPPKQESVSDENRPLTVAEFRKLLDQQRQADQQNAIAVRQAESERLALTEYTGEKCGDGLDYANVIAIGEKNLTDGDKLAIQQAKDPAAEKYRRCIMLTPELAGKQESVKTSRLLEQIKLTGKVPPTGGGEVKATPADVSRMSQEELDRLAESLG
jgi:vacuolar-type H+-ATPase subunit I/STV1